MPVVIVQVAKGVGSVDERHGGSPAGTGGLLDGEQGGHVIVVVDVSADSWQDLVVAPTG